jgi:hypothetical protein
MNIPHSVALRGAYRSATDYASSMIAIGAEYQIEFGDPCHRFRGVEFARRANWVNRHENKIAHFRR